MSRSVTDNQYVGQYARIIRFEQRCANAAFRDFTGWIFVWPFGMCGVKTPSTAFDFMVAHRAVDSLPEIGVSNRHTTTKAFPSPFVFTPLSEATFQPAADVAAPRDQRDAGRLLQCL